MLRSLTKTLTACLVLAGCTETVKSVDDAKGFQAALDDARPGQTILLAPGTYKGAFRLGVGTSGTETQPIRIGPSEGPGTVILEGENTAITLKFTGSSHVIVSDLDITGGGYHGVFFDQGAQHITIQGSRIYDNHRTHPLNSHAEIKGSGADDANRPAYITIADNEIFHTSHPPGGNFQGIDCNRCDDFVIRGNHIHGINAPTQQPDSYYDRGSCIQMKSLSRRTIIERNRIENCHIGIVYGGEGMETPEHEEGVVRNNMIIGSHDIGIVIADVKRGQVVHNTLIGNKRSILLGTHRKRPDALNKALIANNLMDRSPDRANPDGSIEQSNTIISAAESVTWFVDSSAGDFRLTANALGAIDRATVLPPPVLYDYDGTRRPQGSSPDIGAFEYVPAVD